MIELILLLQADLDIQAAFGRYEDYQQGRGELFMRQLDAALGLLRQHPEIAPVYARPYRRMLYGNSPMGFSTNHSLRALLSLRSWISDRLHKLSGESSASPATNAGLLR
jgi:hypothetical protein